MPRANKHSQPTSWTTKIADFIRLLSIGKYNHGLYHRGRSHHSSIVGGLLTLILVGSILTYLIFTLNSIIMNQEFNLD
jgi:uncharacterized metal-binding protein